MERLAGESFEEYRARRKIENRITKGHLRGRFKSGRYADNELHMNLQKVGDDARRRKWWLSVMFKVFIIACGVGLWWLING